MGMRPGYLGIAVAALVTAACPQGDVLIGGGGLGIGSGGGGGSHTLVFTVQPSNANVREAILPAIQVTVRDSLGNPDSSFTAAVTIAVASNPVGGNLSGTTSVTPFNGIALFGDLSIDKAGSGYTLRATAPGASGATSTSFTITTPP